VLLNLGTFNFEVSNTAMSRALVSAEMSLLTTTKTNLCFPTIQLATHCIHLVTILIISLVIRLIVHLVHTELFQLSIDCFLRPYNP